jgi:hypothetical protein
MLRSPEFFTAPAALGFAFLFEIICEKQKISNRFPASAAEDIFRSSDVRNASLSLKCSKKARLYCANDPAIKVLLCTIAGRSRIDADCYGCPGL